ncbi:MAG TPA: cytochrome c maturation protein CcmE [Croceibacterium sp.]|nr:cytochrome c maturation protein CcmE [Croceibacterium sp.]
MTTVFKPKHQRLVLVVLALVAILAAGALAAWALKNQASYFYIPSEIVAHPPPPDRGVRLGGMVKVGSLKTASDGVTMHFVVDDGKTQVPVTFAGIAPDLFKEGSGVVAEGHMRPGGTFVADNLLAKHDENYVPRELQEMTKQQARQAVAETK